ncbi:Serpentine type 7TM GPCR chemoreceptor Srsx [Tyrophagus putrescentiae]|nr:Serpentine type 7TM GPCR chemoreceptor Srsx [Tyrophagus putrescentiae]
MLVLVLITFAISWLPLHIFCLWRDFSGGNVHYTKVCSVVYNPWIYSARNKHFRNGMKNFFRYLVFKRRSSEATLNGFEAGINANTQATQLSRGPSTRDRVGNGGGVRSSNSSFYLCHSIHRNHICASSFCNRAQACMRSSTSSLEESSTLPSNTIVTTAPTTFHQQQTQPQTQQHPLQSSKINDNSTVHHHHLQSNGKQQQQHHQPGPQQCHSDTAVVCDVVNYCSSSTGQDDNGGRQPNRSSSSSSIADCSSLMAKLSPLIACNRQTDSNSVNHCVINSKNDLAAAETASDDAHLSSPLWPSTNSAATKLNGFTVQASNQHHSSPVSFSSCHNVSLLSCSPQGDLRLTNYYDNPQKSKSKENDHHHHSRDSVFASPTVVKKCNSTTVVSTTTTTTTMSADSNNNEESRV